MRFTLIVTVIAALITISGGHAFAQDEAKQPATQTQGGDDLRSAVQNPVSSMISLPLKFTADFGAPLRSPSVLKYRDLPRWPMYT